MSFEDHFNKASGILKIEDPKLLVDTKRIFSNFYHLGKLDVCNQLLQSIAGALRPNIGVAEVIQIMVNVLETNLKEETE